MKRNNSRNPWTNRLDVQLALSLSSSLGNIQIVASAINLIESKLERTNNIDRVVEVLRGRGRVGDDPNADLIFDYRSYP